MSDDFYMIKYIIVQKHNFMSTECCCWCRPSDSYCLFKCQSSAAPVMCASCRAVPPAVQCALRIQSAGDGKKMSQKRTYPSGTEKRKRKRRKNAKIKVCYVLVIEWTNGTNSSEAWRVEHPFEDNLITTVQTWKVQKKAYRQGFQKKIHVLFMCLVEPIA